MTNTPSSSSSCSSQSNLQLHGAAANSTPHSLLTLPPLSTNTSSSTPSIAYASSGIINLVSSPPPSSSSSSSSSSELSSLPHVTTTLRTSTLTHKHESLDRVITSLCTISSLSSSSSSSSSSEKVGIGCAFSDGTITTWWHEQQQQQHSSHPSETWSEVPIVAFTKEDEEEEEETLIKEEKIACSITDIDGIYHTKQEEILIISGAANGVHLHSTPSSSDKSRLKPKKVIKVSNLPTATLKLHPLCSSSSSCELLILVGTALPRFNKIGVYTYALHSAEVKQHGFLLGHQDWITSFAILSSEKKTKEERCSYYKVASGSKDAKIRLWNIHPPTSFSSTTTVVIRGGGGEEEGMINEDTDEGLLDDLLTMEEEEEEEDVARLQIVSEEEKKEGEEEEEKQVRNVSLEALLIGHEETITSVSWRPSSASSFSVPILMSSSMDRTILLWASSQHEEEQEEEEKGVWMPITRLGVAGGILGGSIGSSLLGFVDAIFVGGGEMIVGHGYGGSLHFFHSSSSDSSSGEVEKKEEKGVVEYWNVYSNITGHFRGVVDICWEVTSGEYLLSVGLDQTCRLWAQIPTSSSSSSDNTTTTTWHEVGRPQVHGYDLTSLTCIGYGEGKNKRGEKKHRFVSGADEKLLRVFDAPNSTVRLLRALQLGGQQQQQQQEEEEDGDGEEDERVERAYIPSLGLSNKAEAKGQMEEEEEIGGGGGRELAEHHGKESEEEEKEEETNKNQVVTTTTTTTTTIPNLKSLLPNERDLGVASLWPEVGKLYGHYYEISCLASSFSSSFSGMDEEEKRVEEILVASACKARDVKHASIRLWNVNQGSCVEVLMGGHRSTVVTLSFSSDNKYLASSGKDRRLCIWKRRHHLHHTKKLSQHQQDDLDGSKATTTTTTTPSSGDNNDEMPSLYTLASAVDSAHKRIVWSVHFCPLEPTLLASGARDGTVKIWRIVAQEGEGKEEGDDCCSDDGSADCKKGDDDDIDRMVELKELYRFEPSCKTGKKAESVTAVAFAPKPILSSDGTETDAILAIGMECGLIEIWAVRLPDYMSTKRTADPSSSSATTPGTRLLLSIPPSGCHIDTVKKLAWRPCRIQEGKRGTRETSVSLTLASCGMDHGVRIFDLGIHS